MHRSNYKGLVKCRTTTIMGRLAIRYTAIHGCGRILRDNNDNTFVLVSLWRFRVSPRLYFARGHYASDLQKGARFSRDGSIRRRECPLCREVASSRSVGFTEISSRIPRETESPSPPPSLSFIRARLGILAASLCRAKKVWTTAEALAERIGTSNFHPADSNELPALSGFYRSTFSRAQLCHERFHSKRGTAHGRARARAAKISRSVGRRRTAARARTISHDYL